MRVESVWKARIIMSNMSSNVFLEAGGDAGRRIHGGVRHILELFRPLDLVLDFPDAGQVLIKFLPVATDQADARGQPRRRGQSRGSTAAVRGGVRGSCLRSPREPAPKRRSKTSRGLGSGGRGMVGLLQARLNW